MPPVKEQLVLLLEDDEGVAEAMALLLHDWGYACVHGSSYKAVENVVEHRGQEIAAIISDYHLEDGGNGLDAVQAARRAGVLAPVLMLTATLRGAGRRNAEAAGFQFMEKPVRIERLEQWLTNALA